MNWLQCLLNWCWWHNHTQQGSGWGETWIHVSPIHCKHCPGLTQSPTAAEWTLKSSAMVIAQPWGVQAEVKALLELKEIPVHQIGLSLFQLSVLLSAIPWLHRGYRYYCECFKMSKLLAQWSHTATSSLSPQSLCCLCNNYVCRNVNNTRMGSAFPSAAGNESRFK